MSESASGTQLWTLALPASGFLVWYLGIGFYSCFSLDDFWAATEVQNRGFWEAQLYFFNNWEGSFYHTFASTVPYAIAPISASIAPLICVGVSLLTLICALAALLGGWRNGGMGACYALVVGLYLASLLYRFTSGGSDVLYWVMANVPYVTAASWSVLSLALLLGRPRNMVWRYLPLPLLFAVGGHKLHLGISGVLFLTYLTYENWNNAHMRRRYVAGFCVVSASVLINILAPGNALRLAQNMATVNDAGEQFGIVTILTYDVTQILLPFLAKIWIPAALVSLVIRPLHPMYAGIAVTRSTLDNQSNPATSPLHERPQRGN